MENNNIGNVIRKIRVLKGLGLKQLGEMCNLSDSYISDIERGAKTPNSNIIDKIATKLDIPLHIFYIMVYDPNNEPMEFFIKEVLFKAFMYDENETDTVNAD